MTFATICYTPNFNSGVHKDKKIYNNNLVNTYQYEYFYIK